MEFSSTLVLVLLVVFISSFIRISLGFGNALIAMPLLSLLIPAKTATPFVAIIATLISFIMLIQNYKTVEFKSVSKLLLSSLFGIPLGLYFLTGSNEAYVKCFLGIMIVGFSTYKLFKPKLLYIKNDIIAFIAGFISGALGAAYNTNGPPVVIYAALKKWPADTFRASMQGFFFPAGLMILVGHGLSGLWTSEVMQLCLISLPIILLAVFIGTILCKKIPQGIFDKYVHVFLILIGMALIAKTILKLS